jgi:hypothetical protein
VQIIIVEPAPQRNQLNVKQLLNLVFFSPTTCHPDSSRQRKARHRAMELKQARADKRAPIGIVAPANPDEGKSGHRFNRYIW